MEIKKLPREMLWTDKTTINEFLKDNPLNQELYKTFVKLKGDSSFITLSAEQVFNEVYYQLSRMVYEKMHKDDIVEYMEDIRIHLHWSYAADLILSMAYVVASLTQVTTLSLNQYQLKVIKDQCWFGLFWHPFRDCLKRIQKKHVLQSENLLPYYNSGKAIVLRPQQIVLNAPKAKVNIIMDNHGNIICK